MNQSHKDQYQAGYQAGFGAGYATGFAEANKRKPTTRAARQFVERQEDELIRDFVENKSITFREDILGFLGLEDNRSNQIVIGHSMRRIGWVKRREAPPTRRWYYERGVITSNA